MNKIIMASALLLLSTTAFAKSFDCTGYANKVQVGETIQVNAAKAIVAETKALARMKNAGLKVEYVRCK